MTPDYAALRRNMVDCQLRTYDVTDRYVLAAMAAVERERFVPEQRRAVAYIDQPVPLDGLGVTGRALLAPMTCGRMLQSLDVDSGKRFFDYACGTGYTAALASELGADVTAFDYSAELREVARNALAGSGHSSVTVIDALPVQTFDYIFVNGACERLPDALSDLLADGGKLVIVEGFGRSGRAMLYQRTGKAIGGRAVFDAAAPRMTEFDISPVFSL